MKETKWEESFVKPFDQFKQRVQEEEKRELLRSLLSEILFSEFHSTVESNLYQRCMVCDQSTVEDISQNSFLTAHAKLCQLREAEYYRVRKWLLQIAYNFYRKYQRSQAKGPRFISLGFYPEDNLCAPKKQMALIEEICHKIGAMVDGEIDVLEDRERLVVYFKYWEDLTHDEIAHKICTSQSNSKIILHRALIKMKEYFKKRAF